MQFYIILLLLALPQVDHFSADDGPLFQQRYLVNTEHWKSGGPILFYTGNEGDITLFCNNTVREGGGLILLPGVEMSCRGLCSPACCETE